MARSMTGFGHAVVSKDGRELSIELKSVNHRFLDLAFRMPRSLAFLEDTARNTLGTMLARGHVDIFANYRNTRNDSKKVEINMPMLSAYMTAARQAAEELGIENDLTLSRALRLTDIVRDRGRRRQARACGTDERCLDPRRKRAYRNAYARG